MRIPIRVIRLQPDESQQFLDPRLGLAPLCDLVDRKGLADDVADGHPRIERRVRVLEDDLHLLTQLANLFAAELVDVASVEDDLALGRRQEAQHDAAGRRLPRPGLADEPQRFAAPDREVDAVDSFHVADVTRQNPGVDRKILVEIANDEQVARRLVRDGGAHLATAWAGGAGAEFGTCGTDSTLRARSPSVRSS